MKNLLVLRHAKSSWANQNLSDHERPLNKRGKFDAPRMGRWLAHLELTPELIICSTAERALTTAEIVALHSGYEAELVANRKFYHASPATYIEELRALNTGSGRVMIVGHNPGMEQLVELLTERSLRMPTAAIAHIELPIDRWEQLSLTSTGTLKGHWIPKGLPADFH